MFTIFTSPKTLQLKTDLNPYSVVKNFQNHVSEDSVVTRMKNAFSHTGEIVGKVDGRVVKLRLVSAISNPFQPEMIVQVDSDNIGGSILNTRYAVPVFPKIFMTIWISAATVIAIMALLSGKTESSHIALLFPFFGTIFILIGRLLALRDQESLEKLVHKVVDHSSHKFSN